MRFNFLIFINLAAIFSLGSSNLDLNQYMREPLPENCLPFVKGTVKNFENCEISVNKSDIEYGEDALPYLCLLTLDVATEFCKVPDRIKKLDRMNRTKTVCPIDYSWNSSNLKINITRGVQYMKNENNCTKVCGFSRHISSVCQFIAFANNVIKEERLNENSDLMKEEGKQPQDLIKSNTKINLAAPGKISQDSKLVSQTMPRVMQGQTLANTVQSVTDEKSDYAKMVVKTDGESTDKKLIKAHFDVKSDVGNTKVNAYLKSNSNNKNINDINGASKVVNEPVLKKEHDNHNEEQGDVNKSQILLNSEDAQILETESPLTENMYGSRTNQNNGDIPNDNNNNNDIKNSNNNNNNNINSDYADDTSILKTPHDEAEDDDDNNIEDMEKSGLQEALPDREPQFAKSLNPKETYSSDNFFQAEDSHFSVYFLSTISIVIIGYVIYHNKKKIVAYALEGRRNRNGRRRPTSASYRKLDCNLEEAIASNPSNASVTNVVY